MTSSLSLHETLEKIVEETCQCLECDRVTVFITDLQRNELWSKVYFKIFNISNFFFK